MDLTPWAIHQRRAASLTMIREAKRLRDVKKLDMVYHGVTQIQSFTRINDRGDVSLHISCLLPIPIDYVVLKLNPFQL